jgi:hypothetical protein
MRKPNPPGAIVTVPPVWLTMPAVLPPSPMFM